MDRSSAETLALKALTWLAADREGLESFLYGSGLDRSVLRARAADPDLLAGVLDHMLASDARTEAFCAAEGIDPRILHAARQALPGAVSD